MAFLAFTTLVVHHHKRRRGTAWLNEADIAQEDGRGGVSEWTERDFETAQRIVSKVCFCTTGGLGMTSEFGLSEGAVGAAAGHNTALFQLIADEPHPELGGGLVCLLEMPHQISNDERLRQVCVRLNNLEMATDHLPPHFGAWCAGQSGNKPAYVSFLPNALHSVSGITVNVAFWALARALWANSMLASLRIYA